MGSWAEPAPRKAGTEKDLQSTELEVLELPLGLEACQDNDFIIHAFLIVAPNSISVPGA